MDERSSTNSDQELSSDEAVAFSSSKIKRLKIPNWMELSRRYFTILSQLDVSMLETEESDLFDGIFDDQHLPPADSKIHTTHSQCSSPITAPSPSSHKPCYPPSEGDNYYHTAATTATPPGTTLSDACALATIKEMNIFLLSHTATTTPLQFTDKIPSVRSYVMEKLREWSSTYTSASMTPHCS